MPLSLASYQFLLHTWLSLISHESYWYWGHWWEQCHHHHPIEKAICVVWVENRKQHPTNSKKRIGLHGHGCLVAFDLLPRYLLIKPRCYTILLVVGCSLLWLLKSPSALIHVFHPLLLINNVIKENPPSDLFPTLLFKLILIFIYLFLLVQYSL